MTLTDEDIMRRNTIVSLLEEWNLLDPENPEQIDEQLPMSSLKVITHKEKNEWTLCPKYKLGNKK